MPIKAIPTTSIDEICIPKTQMPLNFVPSSYDILCGKGRNCIQNVGNQRLRVQIDMNIQRYKKARNKYEKTLIVSEIVEAARSYHPTRKGHFVRQESGRWVEIGDKAAREKIGHTIRMSICPRRTKRANARKNLRKMRSKAKSEARYPLSTNSSDTDNNEHAMDECQHQSGQEQAEGEQQKRPPSCTVFSTPENKSKSAESPVSLSLTTAPSIHPSLDDDLCPLPVTLTRLPGMGSVKGHVQLDPSFSFGIDYETLEEECLMDFDSIDADHLLRVLASL